MPRSAAGQLARPRLSGRCWSCSYDRLVSLGARYLQFQPLMSEGAALREGYQLSADNG
jgi:hypothetical protein